MLSQSPSVATSLWPSHQDWPFRQLQALHQTTSNMASITTIPTEIRMKIWRFAIPEEVETEILEKTSPFSTHDHENVSLPANPVVPLLLSCHQFREEITMVTKPLLTAVSREEFGLNLELWYAKEVRHAFDRVKIFSWFDYLPTENLSSETLRREFDVASIMHKYYSTVEKVYLRTERKAYQPNVAFPLPPVLVRYQYSLLFEVSGARRQNELGPV